jgi:hypothetical protein
MGDAPAEFVTVNIARIEDATGVSRQTIHNWIKADIDDSGVWFKRYDGATAHRLKTFFSELLGRDVEVIEQIEIEDSPRFQETPAIAVSAA